jgi:hypothetical protein
MGTGTVVVAVVVYVTVYVSVLVTVCVAVTVWVTVCVTVVASGQYDTVTEVSAATVLVATSARSILSGSPVAFIKCAEENT